MSWLNWEEANRFIDANTTEISSNQLGRKPLVSICVLTFNHEAFVKRSLDSIVSQIVDFPIEVIVSDDKSSDGTVEIIKQYQLEFPDKIKLLLSINNLGSKTGDGRLNVARLLKHARGKYIAFLEGDDFWTDCTKLQQQARIMEDDSALAAVTHDTNVVFENTGHSELWRESGDRVNYSLSDLIKVQCMFHLSSFFYRSSVLAEIPQLFLNVPSSDLAIFLLVSSTGPIRHIPKPMSVYRKHDGGITNKSLHKGVDLELNRINMHKLIMRHLGTHKKEFHAVITKHAKRAIAISLKRNWLLLPYHFFRIAAAIGFLGTFRLFGGKA